MIDFLLIVFFVLFLVFFLRIAYLTYYEHKHTIQEQKEDNLLCRRRLRSARRLAGLSPITPQKVTKIDDIEIEFKTFLDPDYSEGVYSITQYVDEADRVDVIFIEEDQIEDVIDGLRAAIEYKKEFTKETANEC